MNSMSRRNVLTAAAAGSLLGAATIANAQPGESIPQPRRPGYGGTDPGPVNIDQARHRDLLVPPSTDHATLPNLRKQSLGNPR